MMKKISFLVIALCGLSLFAAEPQKKKYTLDVDFGYMSYLYSKSNRAEISGLSAAETAAIEMSLGGAEVVKDKQDERVTSFAHAFLLSALFTGDMGSMDIFAKLNLGFPGKQSFDGMTILPGGVVENTQNGFKLSRGSFIFEASVGAGKKFYFSKNKLELFVAAGLGMTAVRTSKQIEYSALQMQAFKNDPKLYSLQYFQGGTETTSTFMLGFTPVLRLSYYFTDWVGVTAGLSDTILLLPLTYSRVYEMNAQTKAKITTGELTDKAGNKITPYKITYPKKDSAKLSKNESIQHIANTFNVQVGVVFKF